MYLLFAKMFPPQLKEKYRAMMKYCDIEMSSEKFIGMTVFFGLFLSLIVSVSLYVIFSYTTAVLAALFASIFILAIGTSYVWLVLRADAKGRFTEEILPDALLLMSMNIRSGMTTDRALIMAARTEFGPLEKELSRAGRQILGGKEARYALLDMTTRIKSQLAERTVRLIVEGIESGGELSSLLQQTAEDIQNTKLVQNEVRSNLLMYAIFIFFAVGIGAPLLFGISTFLVSSIGTQFSAFQSSGLSGQAAETALQVGPDFLTTFAIVALTVTSLFAGLIIGIIKDGNEKAGVKFIPLLIVLSISVFFAVRSTVSSIFPSF